MNLNGDFISNEYNLKGGSKMTHEEHIKHLDYVGKKLYSLLNELSPEESFNVIIKQKFRPKKKYEYNYNETPGFGHSLSSGKLFELETRVKSAPKETAGQYIKTLVDQRKIKDSMVYLDKEVNIPKEYWHKIIHNQIAAPSINRLIRIACFFELTDKEFLYFLDIAGYSINMLDDIKSKIITFCFSEKVYSISDIESFLLEYNQPSIYDPRES